MTDLSWTAWAGGKCPVDPDATVIVRYRADADGFDFERYRKFRAGSIVWEHYDTAPETDIIAYREASA